MRISLFFFSFGGFSHIWGNLAYLGSNYSLECLNDYLFTITCVLNVSAEVLPNSATSWLQFYEHVDLSQGHKCVLKAQTHEWVCVLDASPWLQYTFSDTDAFQISLNSSYHGNSSSVVLEMDYMPVKHIRPVPPTNLSLLLRNNHTVFYWLSGYQEDIFLIPYLQYQLNICSKDQVLDVQLDGIEVVVDVDRFTPRTSYTARVRSRPNQAYNYQGVWSQWSSAIHWTTPIHKADMSDGSLPLWFALICLLPVLLLFTSLLFYIQYFWCKRQVVIPSPAPYFRDFKNLAVLPHELLQQEESLKIDNMFEDFDTDPQPSSTHNEMISICVNSVHTFIPAPPRSPSMLHYTDGAEGSCSWLCDVMAAESSCMTYDTDHGTLSHTRLPNKDYCALPYTH